MLRRQIDRVLRRFERDFTPQNHIEISGTALRNNLALFKRLTGKKIIPVLKGNAYGHGVVQVARALEGVEVPYLAVDGYFEALRAREVTRRPILIMGAILPENFRHIRYDNFAFVVQDEITIRELAATKKKIRVHLECNTGMNRYGAIPSEVERLAKLIVRYENLELEGVMSHLADSDGDSPDAIHEAVACFDACIEVVHRCGVRPRFVHVAQTAGSVRAESTYANTVRLGIGLYGLNPFDRVYPLAKTLDGLKPALRFTSTITKVIDLKKGDHVGYGYTFTAPANMKIGVIPVGYYEGLNRALSNKGVVKVGSYFVPIVGKVCMNHTMISLEGTKARVGDEVIVYSDRAIDRNAIDNVADEHNLFNYNLLSALSPDVRRNLIERSI